MIDIEVLQMNGMTLSWPLLRKRNCRGLIAHVSHKDSKGLPVTAYVAMDKGDAILVIYAKSGGYVTIPEFQFDSWVLV